MKPAEKSVDGPGVTDIQATLENLCAELNSSIYNGGVDRKTLIGTIEDIYKWIVVDRNNSIALPAPSDNPSDRFRFIFPDGAQVTTRVRRSTSVSSKGSACLPKSARKLSNHYTQSCSSVSRNPVFQSKHIGFVEDDVDPPYTPPLRTQSNQPSDHHHNVRVGDIRGDLPYVDESTENLYPAEMRRSRKPKPVAAGVDEGGVSGSHNTRARGGRRGPGFAGE